ncbi:MAG: tyrosine-protein phosphatase [Victivallales bacterium]|nr:tyrosine-protein phosphatase [Victivallales bacterium]
MKKGLWIWLCLPGMLVAEIVPTEIASPVVLLYPEQKKIMQYDTHDERVKVLTEDHKLDKKQSVFFNTNAKWREAMPVKFSWTCTDGEMSPFFITLADNEAFENPQIFGVGKGKTSVTPPNCQTNFKIGQKYYWKVTGISKDKKTEVTSAVSTFTTKDMAPRWIKLEGRVGNTRDLGGWKTADGRRIKQNMIFRGQGLNDNSYDNGKRPGRNRLTTEDVNWMLNTLHIKTDLDLRSERETANMTESPLGPTVQFIHNSSAAYRGIFSENGKAAMAKNFRVFANPDNYPIYFHCIGGADRCGSLSLVLEGILGVPERELGIDWENTFYPSLPDLKKDQGNFWQRYDDFLERFPKFGKKGDSFNKCVEKYLLSCGITLEEIETFREIMLE